MITATAPTGRERTFGDHEFIVSKTDLRGHITYVNDVFLRVAGYEEHEVLGQPHNMIRHPDMPRAVFALLWQEIAAGREISAYVVNLAKNGDHYWVLAHVGPTVVDGEIIAFHSNRRRPDRDAVDAVVPIYRALAEEEHRHERRSDAIAASSEMLGSWLHDRGTTYEEWVWSITGVDA